jgi:hyaluronoglucosaminidase
MTTLFAIKKSGGFVPCEIEDYPNFPVRGVIEGFYGPPWSDEERIGMMDLLANYKMNTYVYGPKDDPYHRERWAVPYDDESLHRLSTLHNAATERGLTFCYSIGPGLSLRYSSRSHLQQLLAKLRQVYAIGVRSFALLLDDIPQFLQHPEDVSSYPDLVSAQIELVSSVHRSLMETDPQIHFAVCPTEYHGKGTEYTVTRLGRSIHPSIDIFWTGPEICSRELTMRDAAVFGEATHHLPLYWDNYPVNDLEMSNELHIGPYKNRESDLWHFSRGIIANGMEYPEASKIPLITIACFAWNSRAYDPEIAHRQAIAEVVGTRDLEPFLLFADNVRSSCLSPEDSPRLSELLERFRFAVQFGDREEAFESILRGLAPFVDASEHMRSGLTNERLMREIDPWVRTFSAGIALLVDTLAYLQHGGDRERESLRHRFDEYLRDSKRVFADVLYPAIRTILFSDPTAEAG